MKTLVVLGSGLEPYRRYVFESLHAAAFGLVLVAEGEPTWERPFLLGYLKIDLQKTDLVRRSLAALRVRQPFDGLFTCVENLVPLMVECQTHFGVAGPAAEAAHFARHKGAMREAFRRAGMLVPQVQAIPDLAAFDASAPLDLPFPMVLKPAMGFASINVQKVTHRDDLRRAVDDCQRCRMAAALAVGTSYLLESYLDGPEFSIESVESCGRFRHFDVVRKYTTDLPFFEEVGHIAGDPEVAPFRAEAERAAETAMRALGIRQSAAHTEFKLTRDGIAVIEVAARLAGDLIPRIVHLARGDDPVVATGHAAAGDAIDAIASTAVAPRRVVGVIFFTPRHAGVLRRVPDEHAMATLPGVLEFRFVAPIGQTFQVPPVAFLNRFGYVLCEGSSRAEVELRLDRVVSQLEAQTGVLYYTMSKTSNGEKA
jgi:biotin carboxylase